MSEEASYFTPEHQDVLRVIALHPEKVDIPAWRFNMSRLALHGSEVIDWNTAATYTKEAQDISDARMIFFHHLGWDNPQHDLYELYTEQLKKRPRGLLPNTVLNNIVALREATGRDDPIPLLQSSQRLIETNVGQRFMQGKALLKILGWDGDPRGLGAERPALLTASSERLALLGRIAATHGQPQDKELSAEKIGRFIDKRAVESSLLAILTRPNYRLGSIPPKDQKYFNDSTARIREKLFQQLADPEAAVKLSPKVLAAYFSYRPFTSTELEAFPYLEAYLTPAQRKASKTELKLKQGLTGREAWLPKTTMNPDQQALWIYRLNLAALKGASQLGGRPSVQKVQSVTDGRIEFFTLLGWADPAHKMHDTFLRIPDDYRRYAVPGNFIETVNLLQSYGVSQPMETVQRRISILGRHATTIERCLVILQAHGVDIPALLAQKLKALTLGEDALLKELAEEPQNFPLMAKDANA